MNFSIYFQSGANIDFYDATPNDISETLQKIGVKFGEPTNNDRLENDVEYFKLKYEKALEQISELDESAEELRACYGEIEKRNDEIDEWKQKYENECKHNDVIKKSYDRLAKSFEELLKERDEYKEIASDRDDLKIENDKIKELCEMLQDESKELQKRISLTREDFLEANRQVEELTEENDKIKTIFVEFVNEVFGPWLKKSES